eukprot:gene25258-33786_t
MFNIIHAQLNVAREKLPPDHIKEVAFAMLQVLQEVQRQSYDSLSEKWREMDPEAMCATINDNERMQEKCDEFGEYLLKFLANEQEKELFREVLGEVSNEYVQIAVKAGAFLARCILEDLDEPFFSKLFSPEWEAGEELGNILVVTLKDYFSDLSAWLGEYYFSKFVYQTLNTIIATYIMMETIERFFLEYLHQLQAGGMRVSQAQHSPETALRELLQPILNLARLITARQLTGAEGDARALFAKWNIDGLRAVQAAFQLHPTISKQEKMQNIEALKKLFDSAGDTYSHQFLDEFLGLDSSTALGVILYNKSAPAGQVNNGHSEGANKMSFFGRRKK